MEILVTGKSSPTEVTCEVIRGGELKSRKGLNIPTVTIQFEDLMEKDKIDAQFMLGLGVDYIGQSFVQTAEDVQRLQAFLKKNAVVRKSTSVI
jgi:pyruvate kinase